MSEEASLGPCGWCGEPAVTLVVVVPGRARKKYAPVCEEHAVKFEREGQMTQRLEVEKKIEADRKRSQWKARRAWR